METMTKSALREWNLNSQDGVIKWLAERKTLPSWTPDGQVEFVPHLNPSAKKHFIEVLELGTRMSVDVAYEKIRSNPSWGQPH